MLLATAAIAAATAFTVPVVLAQGTPQTIQLVKVDIVKVSTGYRTSKVLGALIGFERETPSEPWRP